ncbi:MAG: hypothetical protein IJ274_10940 [Lachnospiraceae bacterium]|nr:hypothetical protein [Lachnospiraceae bacterium]
MKIWEKYKKIVMIIVPVITIVILGCLVGAIITMQDKMTEMGNQLSYLIDTNSILQSQVSNLQSNIETALEEEGSLVEQQSIEVVDTDFSTGTYEVKISVVPKEYSDVTKVSVFFGANEIPLTLNRYAYEGTAELSLGNNYDGNVTFLFVNGDKKSTEILKNYESLQTKLKDLLYGSIPEIPEYKDGKILFSDEISYTLNAYETYGYETLELVLMADEENLVIVNLLENIKQVAEANTKMVYGMSGTTEFKHSYEVEEGQTIRLFLRSKCENGYTFEYDLFSGIVQAEGPNGFAETEDYFVPNYCVYDSHGNKFEMK